MKDLIENHWTTTSATYNRWTRNNLQSAAVRRTWLQCLRGTFGAAPLRVLDVGTGPGFMAFFLAELGHQVTGVDLSPGMLEQARANAERLNLNVRFEQGDAERLPFPDHSFDAVVNRIILWTMTEPEQALREWTRVLKPGGRLAIIDIHGTQVRRTLTHKLWRIGSVPLVMLTEGRNPLKNNFSSELREQLPLSQVERPEWELAELSNLGYRDLRQETISRRSLGWMEYLKHGCWGDYYLITGLRP